VIAWTGCQQRKVAEWQVNRDNRMMFHQVLLDAERKLCPECPNGACGPPVGVNYAAKLWLDIAAKLEKEISDDLTAAEYLTLAKLGDSCWDFKQVSGYCEKALARSSSDLDKYYSHLLLGQLHFRHYKSEERASIFAAREHFKAAATCVKDWTDAEGFHYFAAMAYVYWAADEAFYGDKNDTDSRMAESSLAMSNAMVTRMMPREWYELVEGAKKGKPPDLPCPSQLLVSPRGVDSAAPAPGAGIPTMAPPPAPKRAPPAPKAT